MIEEVIAATNALEGLATFILSSTPQGYYQTLNGAWTTPPLSRDDLASQIRATGRRLAALPDGSVDGDLRRKSAALPGQLAWFQAHTLPQIQQNFALVVSNLDLILRNIDSTIPQDPTLDWEVMADSHMMPIALSRKLRSLAASIDRISPKVAALDGVIQSIEDAHSAALALPVDLQTLSEATAEMTTARDQANQVVLEIRRGQEALEGYSARVKESADLAEVKMSKIEQAYSAATSSGLAASFQERAASLRRSTWVWVVMLVAALGVGAAIGYSHYVELSGEVSTSRNGSSAFWPHAVLAFVSVAPSIWLAWVSTRQIGQRFRLAEDYGFKASFARAYEGYRFQAGQFVDPKFAERLFESALDRLDEAPMRFLSMNEHGSPYEALLASAGFQKALEKLPSVREAFAGVAEKLGMITKPAEGRSES
jgi:hypothetical protein